MATLYTNRTSATAANVKPARSVPGLNAVSAQFTLAAALANADVINIVMMPKGAKLLGLFMSYPDLDSGTTAQFTIGDAGSSNRLMTASSAFQTAANLTPQLINAAVGYEYTEDTMVTLTMTAGPTTASSGTINFVFLYYVGDND